MQQILRGTPATLTVTLYDADGTPTAATGTLTVGVVAADGTVVKTPGTATAAGDGTGQYTVQVPASATTKVTLLTASWLDAGSATVWSTTHEVVGGYLFSIADARDAGLDDPGQYPTSMLVDARTDVTGEAEWICGTSLVPRYRRLLVDGTGTDRITLSVPDVTAVTAVTMSPTYGSSSTTVLTVAQLAGLVVGADYSLRRTDGGVFFDGASTIAVVVQQGRTDWGSDLRRAALTRLVDLLGQSNSSIPLRAKRYNTSDGFSWDLTDQDEFTTGIPTVDAVYGRYSRRTRPGASSPVPISRTVSYDPQWGALFAGGPR